jgi:hypothetical protein
MAQLLQHGTVYREPGRFAGWPANYGMWAFEGGEEPEIVLCFTSGRLGEAAFDDRFHQTDQSQPFETIQARSIDGGVSWTTALMPAASPGGRAISADEHMHAGKGLRVGEAIEGDLTLLPPCPGGVPFAHPEFALMCGRTGLEAGCRSFFYWSVDRCHCWEGPFALPSFGTTGVAARTDYLVLGADSCLLLLTVNKSNGKEGRVAAVRTDDGGQRWRLTSFLGDEPEGFQIMPASTRLPGGAILTATRTTGPAQLTLGGKDFDRGFWIDLFRSDDEGASFTRLANVTGVSRSGNPPTLTRLIDGRLVLVVGWRLPPYGVRARISSDDGNSWGEWIVLRDDGGCGDIGKRRRRLYNGMTIEPGSHASSSGKLESKSPRLCLGSPCHSRFIQDSMFLTQSDLRYAGYPRTVMRHDGKLVTAYYYAMTETGERFIGVTIWEPPPPVVTDVSGPRL